MYIALTHEGNKLAHFNGSQCSNTRETCSLLWPAMITSLTVRATCAVWSVEPKWYDLDSYMDTFTDILPKAWRYHANSSSWLVRRLYSKQVENTRKHDLIGQNHRCTTVKFQMFCYRWLRWFCLLVISCELGCSTWSSWRASWLTTATLGAFISISFSKRSKRFRMTSLDSRSSSGITEFNVCSWRRKGRERESEGD